MASPAIVIAAFVTAHGFGHAARCAAVVEALHRLLPSLRVELFTAVPDWFFADSLSAPLSVHAIETDVGLIQLNPLDEDLDATAAALDGFLPFSETLVDDLARRLHGLACQAVLCDISPLGLAVAAQAGLPDVLIENFTWDWIYRAYPQPPHRLLEHAQVLERHFVSASLHLQTKPVCAPSSSAGLVAPVSRRPRQSRRETRSRLGVPQQRPMVLVTMGGTAGDYGCLARLGDRPDTTFVLAGGGSSRDRRGNVVLLPRRCSHYHPDLVHAADLVVGKLGYSTVAETYHAGCRLAYVPRPCFPESPVLARFVDHEMAATRLDPGSFASLGWLDQLDCLLALPTPPPPRVNGADQAAQLIAELLTG